MTDQAYLYDSAGADDFVARPEVAFLTGPGYYDSARGFQVVYAYATAIDGPGVQDTAYLFDSSGADAFQGGPGLGGIPRRGLRTTVRRSSTGCMPTPRRAAATWPTCTIRRERTGSSPVRAGPR